MRLSLRNVSFAYRGEGGVRHPVLKDLSLEVPPGEMLAIQGPSGSGKSTLLYILGGMLRPDAGTVRVGEVDLTRASDLELAWIRNRRLGFVFQQFHLLPRASVLDNVAMPSLYPCETPAGDSVPAEVRRRALGLIGELGLEEHASKPPNRLSGGQQQRVAVARALFNDASAILADEPTGNLDSASAAQALKLLRELCARGKTVVIITHDPEVARACDRVVHFRDGAIVREERLREPGGNRGDAETLVPPRPPAGLARLLSYARALAPLAWANVGRNRARSALTMVGVAIGVAAVLSMLTLGDFARTHILGTYEAMGVNKVQLNGWPNWELRAQDKPPVLFRSFRWENDLAPLRTIFPQIALLTPIINSWAREAVDFGGRQMTDIRVYGVNQEAAVINGMTVAAGRWLSAHDVESASPVCVIGAEIASRLLAQVQPVGQILHVTGNNQIEYTCRVIGVLERKTVNNDYAKPNESLVLPYTYVPFVYGQWQSRIRGAIIQVAPGHDVEETGKMLRGWFERKYGKSGQFSVDSDSVLIAQMKKFLTIFQILLAAIAAVTLGVGGMGITNMMLASVSERYKEIGLRKALGATDTAVRAQFLMESVALCAVAGAAGLVLGFTAIQGLVYAATFMVPSIRFEWILNGQAVFVSLASILAVGVLSGLVPAIRAERLQVIEALRSE